MSVLQTQKQDGTEKRKAEIWRKISMSDKLKVGILGGTGMVGQRFISLLENHPWFEVVAIAASPRSAGKAYVDAVGDNWKMTTPMPEAVKNIVVKDINQIEEVTSEVDFVFSAVNMSKDEIKKIEEEYAKTETPVVSNNSAHRWTPDVPMVVPELNPEHLEVIEAQKKRLGTTRGFIVVKPNCSIQSYTPALHALREFKPKTVVATTYQAISGAGKTFKDWPEMEGNIIPFISGEEEKSEQEPLRIWGHIEDGKIVKAEGPVITCQCIRVPVLNGHTAAVFVTFENKPSKEQILKAWKEFKGLPQELNLPSAPKQFIQYLEDDNRPQVSLDVDYENGFGISLGRLREDTVFDYKFVGLSHNTVRGAAGGAVLIAELLKAQGYITAK
jgi:aspartate-semialdehyde dehydrogenase